MKNNGVFLTIMKMIVSIVLILIIVMATYFLLWNQKIHILVVNNSTQKMQRVSVDFCKRNYSVDIEYDKDRVEIVLPISCGESELALSVYLVDKSDPLSTSGGYYASSVNYRDVYFVTANGVNKILSEPFLPFIGKDPWQNKKYNKTNP